jgi:toxin ParE1/3/4
VKSRVHHTVQARADLLAIWREVAMDNPAAADRLYDRLEARVRILETFPEAGVARPDIAPEARMLIEPPYLLLYRLLPAGVQIVRVLYGARRMDPLLFQGSVQ